MGKPSTRQKVDETTTFPTICLPELKPQGPPLCHYSPRQSHPQSLYWFSLAAAGSSPGFHSEYLALGWLASLCLLRISSCTHLRAFGVPIPQIPSCYTGLPVALCGILSSSSCEHPSLPGPTPILLQSLLVKPLGLWGLSWPRWPASSRHNLFWTPSARRNPPSPRPSFRVRALPLQLGMTRGDFVPSQQPPEQEEHTGSLPALSWVEHPETQARQVRAPAGGPSIPVMGLGQERVVMTKARARFLGYPRVVWGRGAGWGDVFPSHPACAPLTLGKQGCVILAPPPPSWLEAALSLSIFST